VFGLPGIGTPASPGKPGTPSKRKLEGPLQGLAVAGPGYQLTLPNGKTLDVIQPSSEEDIEKQEASGKLAGLSAGLSEGQKAAKDKQPDKFTEALKKAFEVLKLGAGVKTLESLEKGKSLQDSLAQYQKWSDFLNYYQHLVDTSQVPSDPYVYAYIQGEMAAIILNAANGVVGKRSTK
jgi:delta 1-pyrroline-5-carboxylate dehydrogenase